MAIPSLSQLLTPVTEDEALTLCLSILKDLGFPVTAWQAGRVQHTRVRLIAKLYSGLTNVIGAFTQSGFPSKAVGSYADLLGLYLFNEARIPAEETEGYLHVESDLSAPALNEAAGTVKIKVGSQTYETIEALVLSPGGSTDVLVRAQIAGLAGNTAVDSVCTLVAPEFVGVTVTNPEYADDTWITVQGRDKETDERYMSRCVGKIARQTYSNNEGAYKAWVLEALPSVNRVTIQQGAGDGEIEITAATPEGALTGGEITTIADYIDGTDGIGRRPINDIVTVGTVVEVTSPAISITAYVRRAFTSGVSDLIVAAIEEYLVSLPIGGEVIGSPPGKARQAEIIKRVMNVPGLVNVTGVPADVTLDVDEIYNPTISVTVVEV